MQLLTALQKQIEEMQVPDEASAMKLRLSLLELMNYVIEKAAAADNRSPDAVALNRDLQNIYIELKTNGISRNFDDMKRRITSVIDRLKVSSAFSVD